MQEAGLHLSILKTWFHLTSPIIQNRYNLVLGSFVVVNHHGQSTLLGCALIKNEDIQSFKWIFKCWLRCMGGKAPKGILIDQCASIQRAIKLSMPTTIHRWCIWHIMKKIPNKLNDYKGYIDIDEMGVLCCHSLSVLSFERVDNVAPKYILERWSKNIKRRHTHIKSI
ncbi:hypothetical protein Ahy_A07g031211 isoform B [Arachis hypogaea]|uniref:Protein FAR1-RELATED SEQUENCE n=1 Tax=Arachis hypogaea TaxID=3818 RepID=A0A445C377_ARAHY|nr:hypothetical protein Ahy_A07g031211 isoform B [Arachis hypogaea]